MVEIPIPAHVSLFYFSKATHGRNTCIITERIGWDVEGACPPGYVGRGSPFFAVEIDLSQPIPWDAKKLQLARKTVESPDSPPLTGKSAGSATDKASRGVSNATEHHRARQLVWPRKPAGVIRGTCGRAASPSNL